MILYIFGVVMFIALILALRFASLEVVVLVTFINLFGFSFYISKEDKVNDFFSSKKNKNQADINICTHTIEDCENCKLQTLCPQKSNIISKNSKKEV